MHANLTEDDVDRVVDVLADAVRLAAPLIHIDDRTQKIDPHATTKKVFFTGGAGFIGLHVVAGCSSEG